MEFAEALRRTMFEFKLSGAEIARLSGVSAPQINQFKNGVRDITTSNFQKILESLPDEAKLYLLNLTVFSSEAGSSGLAAEQPGKYSVKNK